MFPAPERHCWIRRSLRCRHRGHVSRSGTSGASECLSVASGASAILMALAALFPSLIMASGSWVKKSVSFSDSLAVDFAKVNAEPGFTFLYNHDDGGSNLGSGGLNDATFQGVFAVRVDKFSLGRRGAIRALRLDCLCVGFDFHIEAGVNLAETSSPVPLEQFGRRRMVLKSSPSALLDAATFGLSERISI